jgi:putative heme-binding domain-containing protein
MVLKEAHAEQVINDALTTPKAADLVDLLGNSGTPAGIARVEAIVAAGNLKPEIREQAVRALARSQSGAEKLIALARDKKLPATLAPTAGRALRSVEYVTLKKDIDELFPVAAAPGGKALPTTADLVKLQGDIAKGRAVFERTESSCVLCHRIGDKGADFGPGLGDIGAKLPKEQIYENIINPSAGLSMGFETTVLTLKDGTTAQGIVRSDTRQEVVLALPGGATNRFEKGQIAKREKLTTSMMPTGLNQLLSQDDLVNLVEYLASLKPQK